MSNQKIRADSMTIQQTAQWIEAFGRYYNWTEAAVYADNFALNEIWGHLLRFLTLDMLETDLEISNHEHRLKIMMAIRYLFPSMAEVENCEDMMDIEQVGSSMLQTGSAPWESLMDISPCNEE